MNKTWVARFQRGLTEAAVLVAAACKRSPYDFLGVKSSWDIDLLPTNLILP